MRQGVAAKPVLKKQLLKKRKHTKPKAGIFLLFMPLADKPTQYELWLQFLSLSLNMFAVNSDGGGYMPTSQKHHDALATGLISLYITET